MPKFNVLQNNQSLMAKLGIYSYRLKEPTNEFYKSLSTYYMLICIVTCSIGSSVAYVIQNISQFSSVLETCKILIISVQYAGMFLNFGLQMKKIKALHLHLQGIVNKGTKYKLFYFDCLCTELICSFV